MMEYVFGEVSNYVGRGLSFQGSWDGLRVVTLASRAFVIFHVITKIRRRIQADLCWLITLNIIKIWICFASGVIGTLVTMVHSGLLLTCRG